MTSRMCMFRMARSLALGAAVFAKMEPSQAQIGEGGCDWSIITADFDWNGTGDYESQVGSCWWMDWETGQQRYSESASQRFLVGASGWGSLFPGSFALGEMLGSTNPGNFVQLGDLNVSGGESLVGLSLVQPDGSVRFGWQRRWASGTDGGQVTTVELADHTDEPVILGVPPNPRWSPPLNGGRVPMPVVTAADRATGVVRRFGYGQRHFNGGVIALTLGHDQRLWGIGRAIVEDSGPGGVSKATLVLFSIEQDGGDFREAAVLGSGDSYESYEISSVPEGFIYVTPGRLPGQLSQYQMAHGTVRNLRIGGPAATIRSPLQLLSDGRIYGSFTGGIIRMNQDGEQIEQISLQATGLTDFNRGVVESPDGWLYVVGQAGGSRNYGGIVRCRPDGSEATRWFEFGAHGMSGGDKKSALTLAQNGNLYGCSDPQYVSLFGINPAGALVWSGSRSAYTLCQPNRISEGSTCHHFGSLGRFDGVLVEGPAEHLYGLIQGAVFRVPMQPSDDTWRGQQLQPVAQTTVLDRGAESASQQAWVQSDTGALFIPTYRGIYSFLPGNHGVEPIRIFGYSGVDGRNLIGPLVRDGRGLIYGVTEGGGTVDEGVIYSAREDGGAGAVLHSFTGNAGDVMKPSGFLVLGEDGWLYGTSQQGERYDFVPRLYRLQPESGTFEVLAPLPGRFDSAGQERCGLVRARDGTLLGTTPRGGAANLGTVFRYAPADRQLTVLHEFGGSANDRWQAWPELLDSADGYLYGLASGSETNHLNADGLFRMRPDGSEYRVLSQMERTEGALRISGGLTETREGSLYTVRALPGAPSTNDVFMGEIVRFVRPSSADEPTRMEVVFRNPVEQEPLLVPMGRMVETADGSLVGLGSRWQTVAYRLDPKTGQVERIAKGGLMDLAREPGFPARYSAPVPLDNQFLVGWSGYQSGRIQRVTFARPAHPVAREPVVITHQYGSWVSMSLETQLFEGAQPPFEVRGLPPGFNAQWATYGTLFGEGVLVGRYVMEVVGGDGFWPPRLATNTLTLTVEPRPLVLDAQPKTVAVGASNRSVTGTVTPSLIEADGIIVSWTTTATSSSPVGEYPITPVILDRNQRLGNYLVTTNPAVLTIMEPRASASVASRELTLTFPGIPGLRYEIESATNLTFPTWHSLGAVRTPTVQPVHWSVPTPDSWEHFFIRITQRP